MQGQLECCTCCSIFQKVGVLIVLGSCRHECGGVLCLPLIILLSWALHVATVFWGFVCLFSSPFSCFRPFFRQHRTVITGLTFSPDGNFMFSSCLQGTLALYSCMAQKSHVLRVLGKTLGLWVAFLLFFYWHRHPSTKAKPDSAYSERYFLMTLLSCVICVYTVCVSKP